MQKNKGFTLIELLVVIAIIGILSSVVLASLNSARNKGADAAVKSNLANTRAQAEIFYDSNGSSYYGSNNTTQVCNSFASATGGIPGIHKHVLAAAKAGAGITTVSLATAPSTTNSVCNASAQAWIATAPLKNPTATTNFYCVDSEGFSGETVAGPGGVTSATDFTCN